MTDSIAQQGWCHSSCCYGYLCCFGLLTCHAVSDVTSF